MHNPGLLLPVLLGVLIIAACEREERGFRVEPPQSSRINSVRLSELVPGPPTSSSEVRNQYEENVYALGEGKRLFSAFNCVGCHGQGGGGMGPPLMDDTWIYGSEPEQVFATIVQGRPNGMPSFGGRIADYQVWQLAAYVRSLAGLTSKAAAPGRSDDMQVHQPESSLDRQEPKASAFPRSSEMPVN